MPASALTLKRLRGRNGSSTSLDLADDICREALNIEWYQSSLGAKREGVATHAHGSVFSGQTISALMKFVPANDRTAAELWGVDDGGNLGRMAAASTFSAVTPLDAISANYTEFRSATLNGKLFQAYNSAVDRMHCWDGTNHRRVGLATPSAPTVADNGSGSYAATLRYYRVRDTIISGSTVVTRSEPSASSAAFTPSGSGTDARVTYVTTNSDAASTHWEVEASTDNVTFWRLARTAEATTTYDDSALVATYTSETASALAGAYEFPVSWRYVAAFHNMLIGLGSWESGNPHSRFWHTAPLATTNEGDDERIINTTFQKNFDSLNENDGGYGTGFGGSLMGNLMAFKNEQIWKLIPTPSPSKPLVPFLAHDGEGAIRQECIVPGLDEEGRKCIYFLDAKKGPCRYGYRGFEWIGQDVQDEWDDFNPAATTLECWGLRYPEKNQIRFWIATGSANVPDTILVFHEQLGAWETDEVGRKTFSGGWAVWNTGDLQGALCGVVFSNTPGSSMSLDERPYYGDSGATDILWKGDNGANDDAGVNFQALITTKDYSLAGGRRTPTFDPVLVAAAASGVTITVSVVEDFGFNIGGAGTARTGTALLTASAASETRVIRRIDDLKSTASAYHQYTIGDAAAASNGWNLDRLIVPLDESETDFRGN